MKLRIIMIGKTDKGFVADGLALYTGRIAKMAAIDQVVIPEAGRGDPAYQQRTESERVLAAIKPGEKIVLLDELGEQLGSTAFADRLQAWKDQGVRQIAFVIGGAYGHSDHLREKAEMILSLSRMTFPHQLVRVLFAEQLYRAHRIMEGRPYHH